VQGTRSDRQRTISGNEALVWGIGQSIDRDGRGGESISDSERMNWVRLMAQGKDVSYFVDTEKI
jgi:hypothetical protein